MRQAMFKEIKANYRRSAFDITLVGAKKVSKYRLPFAVFRKCRISSRNRVVSAEIDGELGKHAVTLTLEDGVKFDFPVDLVLYYCDPSYDWSPINQLKRVLREKAKTSKLSVRVLADALKTSPSQVVRLLESGPGIKQWEQLSQIAELAGYRIEIQLKKKSA